MTEDDLTTALHDAMSATGSQISATVNKFKDLRFISNDPALDTACLRARSLKGSLAVYFSSARRILHIAAEFDNGLSVDHSFRLPQKYWSKNESRTDDKANH